MEYSSKVSNSFFCFFVALSFLIISYVSLRASSLSITYDEATSWASVNNVTYYDILFYKKFSIANNHVLNSFWIKLLIDRNKGSMLLFRSGNLISLLLYLFSVYVLLRRLNSTIVFKCISFTIIVCQPYVLDYFALARGYGISLGLIIASLCLLYEFIYTKKLMLLNLSSLVACLSAVSNFSFVYMFMMILIINFIIIVFTVNYSIDSQRTKYFYFIADIICVIVLLLYIYPLGKELSLRSDTVGSDAGIIGGTLSSVMYAMLGEIREFPVLITRFIKIVFLTAFIGSIFNFLYKMTNPYIIVKKKFFTIILYMIIFGCLIIISIQYNLNNVKYPLDRTILYLFPLIYLSIVFSVSALPSKITYILFYVFSLFPIIIFLLSINFAHYQASVQDEFNKNIASYFNNINKEHSGKKYLITDLNPLSFEYYNKSSNLKFIWIHDSKTLSQCLKENNINLHDDDIYTYLYDRGEEKYLSKNQYFCLKTFLYYNLKYGINLIKIRKI